MQTQKQSFFSEILLISELGNALHSILHKRLHVQTRCAVQAAQAIGMPYPPVDVGARWQPKLLHLQAVQLGRLLLPPLMPRLLCCMMGCLL